MTGVPTTSAAVSITSLFRCCSARVISALGTATAPSMRTPTRRRRINHVASGAFITAASKGAAAKAPTASSPLITSEIVTTVGAIALTDPRC